MEKKLYFDIQVVDDQKLFFDLRSEWNNLLTDSNSNTIFLTWEWLYYWWCEYGDESKQLYIIIVRENNRLIGIAPLYSTKKYFFIKKINFLGSNVVCSDYLNFIIINERDKDVLLNILSFLHRQKFWGKLTIADIPSNSKNCQIIEDYFNNYWLNIQRQCTECPYIDLTTDWDRICDSYSSFLQRTIKRKKKAFDKLINAEYVESCSEKDLENYYVEFLKMNELRLKEKNIDSPFLKKDFQSFHRSVIKEFHTKGMVKLNFLKIENQFVAGIYLLIYNGRYHYYQSGFHPSFGKLSPGTLLLHQSIKTAFDNGANEFDFLQGNEKYKEQWTKLKKYNSLIIIYNTTIRGQMLFVIDFFIRKTKDVCRGLIAKLNSIISFI